MQFLFTKKDNKQSLNYRPISLLPIVGKIFEMTIYNNVFEYLATKKLISDNQSGFKPGDSCVNQLLSITHEIYHSLDNGRKLRGVSLDTFKAFDKVWHVGLMFKLSDEISSNPKLFSYDTSLFSVVHDKNTSAKELNNDWRKISNWAYQWKMTFNPNPLKQAQEVVFSLKMSKTNHPTLIFNDSPVHQIALQKTS